MNTQMISLTYRSRVQLADPAVDIFHVLQSSSLNNPHLGVTGILHYNGVHFVQTLEGPRYACYELFAKISKDRRHTEIRAFGLGPISQRRFPDWSMRLVARHELRILVPELELLDVMGPDDVDRTHLDICLKLQAEPLAPGRSDVFTRSRQFAQEPMDPDCLASTPVCPECGESAALWQGQLSCGWCHHTESTDLRPYEHSSAFEARLTAIARKWAVSPYLFVTGWRLDDGLDTGD